VMDKRYTCFSHVRVKSVLRRGGEPSGSRSYCIVNERSPKGVLNFLASSAFIEQGRIEGFINRLTPQ
jgi:hypothetical protein